MRVCHNDTCPVGIATQNKDLRALFRGKADHVVNFMHFIAEELREVLASLGIRTVEELVDVPTCYNAQVELMNNQKQQH